MPHARGIGMAKAKKKKPEVADKVEEEEEEQISTAEPPPPAKRPRGLRHGWSTTRVRFNV